MTDTTGIFSLATRRGYRYDSARGPLTTEDLWSLPLERPLRRQSNKNYACLDDVARSLNKELMEQQDESFVKPRRNDKAAHLRIKLDVVKYVIEYKMLASAKREEAAMRAQEKAKLVELVAQKDEEALAALSKEELIAKLNDL